MGWSLRLPSPCSQRTIVLKLQKQTPVYQWRLLGRMTAFLRTVAFSQVVLLSLDHVARNIICRELQEEAETTHHHFKLNLI